MNFSKREAVMLIVLLIISVIYSYYEYMYMPIERKTAAFRASNEQLENSIQIKKDLLTRQNAALDSHVARRESYQHLLWRVPEEPCLPEIIAYLAAARQQSEVEIIKFSCTDTRSEGWYSTNLSRAEPGEEKKQLDYDALFMELEAAGDYNDLLSFILQIENAPRLFRLSSLIMESRPGHTGTSGNPDSAKESVPQEESSNEKSYSQLNQEPPRLDHRSLALSDNDEEDKMSLKLKFMAFYDPDSGSGLSGMNPELMVSDTGSDQAN